MPAFPNRCTRIILSSVLSAYMVAGRQPCKRRQIQQTEERTMPPELKAFFRYWSLTFAVLFFFVFGSIVAGRYIWEQVMETIRNRRSQLGPGGPALAPNPLRGKTVAETLGMGPGQQPDEKRQWVLDLATEVSKKLGLTVRILVLEDSMKHPLVHFHDGKQLRTYRVDKTWVAEGRAGNAQRIQQIRDLLERYLASDFLGRQDLRPKKTTELAPEAASKPAPARPGGPAAPPGR